MASILLLNSIIRPIKHYGAVAITYMAGISIINRYLFDDYDMRLFRAMAARHMILLAYKSSRLYSKRAHGRENRPLYFIIFCP